MNSRSLRILGLLLCVVFATAGRASAGGLTDNFITVEQIQKMHEILGITEEQRNAVAPEVEGLQAKINELKQQIETESAKLMEMTKGNKVDEAQTLAQADKIMALESQVKRAQLTVLIKIKNALTPEQIAKAKQAAGKMDEIKSKMERIREIARDIKDRGGDLSAFEPRKEQFEELMRAGNVEKATELLDKTLKELEQTAKSGK